MLGFHNGWLIMSRCSLGATHSTQWKGAWRLPHPSLPSFAWRGKQKFPWHFLACKWKIKPLTETRSGPPGRHSFLCIVLACHLAATFRTKWKTCGLFGELPLILASFLNPRKKFIVNLFCESSLEWVCVQDKSKCIFSTCEQYEIKHVTSLVFFLARQGMTRQNEWPFWLKSQELSCKYLEMNTLQNWFHFLVLTFSNFSGFRRKSQKLRDDTF